MRTKKEPTKICIALLVFKAFLSEDPRRKEKKVLF